MRAPEKKQASSSAAAANAAVRIETSRNPGSSRALLLVFVSLLLVLPPFLWDFRQDIERGLGWLRLLPEHDRFTELYFEDYDRLEHTAAPGQPVSLSFTVRNLEGRSRNYRYDVRLLGARELTLLERNTLEVPADGERTLPKSYLLPAECPGCAVSVVLIDENQEIRFHLDNRIY